MAIVKTVNWEGGSNARYDVNQMTPEERQMFDSEGRPLVGGMPGDGPDQWTPGLPGARGGSGPGDMGGGGGSALSNPYFGQLKASMEAQSAAELANTKAAIQQALIGFGLVPEGFQDKIGALDDLTRELIAKNTGSGISTYARLLEAKQDNLNNVVRRLTSRGLRRSGARGKLMRRGQLDWDRLFQDSLSSLMKHTGGLYNQYTNNEFARQQQLMAAMSGMNFGGSGSRVGLSSPTQQTSAPAPAQSTSYTFGQPVGSYGTTYAGSTVQAGEPMDMFDLGNGVVAY